ncbi:MAG TPA: CbtB domain-containing protein [Solirubrobacteraceae bacterium]|nr:CbtB domain-containing protein [Solirubrobacteraceae bacterium]
MDTTVIQPIPLRDLRPAFLLGGLALLVLWLVSCDQGQISQAGALLHERMHDGRHVFGVPCH